MLWIDVTDVNMKLEMRVINRHIISFIMDGELQLHTDHNLHQRVKGVRSAVSVHTTPHL